MYLKKLFFVLFFLYPLTSNSDDNIGKSKIFVEKLGKQVVEKVSNTEITEQERYNNFKQLYLSSFDNYYISRFVLGRYWKTIDKVPRNNLLILSIPISLLLMLQNLRDGKVLLKQLTRS